MARPSADVMKRLVKEGKAMPAPGEDRPGRFPVRNQTDLENAIRAVGRVKGGEDARRKVRRYIIRRAKALTLSQLIPDTWNSDGTLKTS